MALNKRGRGRSVAAASVCIAITTNGCFGSVKSQTRQEDVVLHSEPVSSPTSEIAYSAEFSTDAGQPITVRTFQQTRCKLAEHQVVDRTLITTTEPDGFKSNWASLLLGVGGMAGGVVLSVQGAQSGAKLSENEKIGAGIPLVVIGSLLVGGYAYQHLRSGETRRHLGQKELSLDRGYAPCGTQTPASEVELRLVNTRDRSQISMRTDGQGQAVIPEQEVTKLDAPVDVFVEGRHIGVNRAAVDRGLIATRERRAQEEQRLAQEREKRAQEEQRLAQELFRARAQRGTAFRKAVKVGDASHCGLVIEVKPPIAKLQTMVGERWLKIEQLYGAGDAPCRFVNGVYQEP